MQIIPPYQDDFGTCAAFHVRILVAKIALMGLRNMDWSDYLCRGKSMAT